MNMKVRLLTTRVCSMCRILKPQLESLCNRMEVPLEIIDAMGPEGRYLVENYDIMQVPVVLVYTDINTKDYPRIFYRDIYIDEIEKYLKQVIEALPAN